MSNRSFYQLLVLFLTGACIFWAGCEPPETTCDDALDSLSISDYCSPANLKVFPDLYRDETEANRAILPDLCGSDYSHSRTVKIPLNGMSKLFVHQFTNFPGKVIVEAFGTNCDSSFTPLLESCESSSDVVNVYEITAANFTTVYFRVVYEGIGDYIPGTREEVDNIAIAAYDGPPNFELFERNEQGDVYRNCDGSSTNRIILSGANAAATAIASGLPVQECVCAEGQLLTISAPVGVDLNALRPRVRDKTAEPDTTNTFRDLIIPVNGLVYPNEVPPSEETYITDNDCLQFNAPTTGSNGGNDVIVTIVDSGVDVDNHGDAFSVNGLPTSGPGCLEFGLFGTDLTDGDGLPNDEVGHGTAVASAVISGYNENRPLTVINAKFFSDQGGSLFNGLCGGYAGIAAGSHIINLSWGFQSEEEPANVKTFLDFAKTKDVVIVVSAGNDGEPITDLNQWPALFGASYSNMLTVASYQNPEFLPPTKPFWSNFGNFDVEVAAFYARQCLRLGGGEWYPAGTSISAPLVTGQLARLKAVNYSDSAEQLVNRFLNSGLLGTSSSLNDVTVGGKYLGLPNPGDNCKPYNDNF